MLMKPRCHTLADRQNAGNRSGDLEEVAGAGLIGLRILTIGQRFVDLVEAPFGNAIGLASQSKFAHQKQLYRIIELTFKVGHGRRIPVKC